MNNTQARVYNAVRRVQNFLDANDAALSGVNKSATRAEFDDVSTQLGAKAGAQAAGKLNAKGETANQRALRLSLRVGYMRPIAAIAKSKLKAVPQFSALTLPPSNASAEKVVVHAEAMAQAAQQYAQVFISAGLAPEFVKNLETAAAAIQASIDTRSKSLGQQTGATGALKTEETRARQLIKVLNTMVVPALTAKDGQSAPLAEWKSIHRVTSKLGPVAGSLQAARATANAVTPVSVTPVAVTPGAVTPEATTPVVSPPQAAA